MSRKRGSALVIVLALIASAIVVGGIIFFRLVPKPSSAVPTTAPFEAMSSTSSSSSYTFKTLSFSVPFIASGTVQQAAGFIRIGRVGIKEVAVLPPVDFLNTLGAQAVSNYKSVLGPSNFASNYALYSYLLQLTTSSVENATSRQAAILESTLLTLKNVVIPTQDNHDISNENQNGIKGIEGTENSTVVPSTLIEVFDIHDMAYTFAFVGFAQNEAEAVFASIKPARQ